MGGFVAFAHAGSHQVSSISRDTLLLHPAPCDGPSGGIGACDKLTLEVSALAFHNRDAFDGDFFWAHREHLRLHASLRRDNIGRDHRKAPSISFRTPIAVPRQDFLRGLFVAPTDRLFSGLSAVVADCDPRILRICISWMAVLRFRG